jgi:hypothetical protein
MPALAPVLNPPPPDVVPVLLWSLLLEPELADDGEEDVDPVGELLCVAPDTAVAPVAPVAPELGAVTVTVTAEFPPVADEPPADVVSAVP